jgi:hypothetical protein
MSGDDQVPTLLQINVQESRKEFSNLYISLQKEQLGKVSLVLVGKQSQEQSHNPTQLYLSHSFFMKTSHDIYLKSDEQSFI